ncbi:GntR family transcriptional regulator [Priestia taiwanensis]|uniref:GntR family transcriptional regulator n=1 Tax=Priestia taiwanensis TaxID=1347902 RepID=A0A917AYG0_9BACI|nr:GntR family transcriptional regulator [Priestia taiwanensis]MBM7364504.1 DNA-binding GntR family transcriptional regulator [Priestia taiwanensis]GGE80980.1 GntR family transcriptional regulator [Priestia taiwanensis]
MKLLRKKGPIYLQIKDILKERILYGEYPIHTNIPSELQLEEEFSVSKITIRNAVEELVKEGYLRKQSGKGTEVINNNVITKLSKGQNFTELLMEQGFTIKKTKAHLEKLKNEEETVLYEKFGATCYRVSRLLLLDGKPYIYFAHYLPSWLDLPKEEETYTASLYHLLMNEGVTFNRFVDEFDVVSPDEIVREHLQMEKQPLLKRIRSVYDEEDRLVEYSEGFYNTEIHRYVVKFDV